METTTECDNLRYTKIPLTSGSGVIPALGFGTLIPDLYRLPDSPGYQSVLCLSVIVAVV